eukprot:TRINITY_DN49693_c0_g1_i1.p1 TRINITY_DN49693_c0_g1~~TRINITY_DN49693_c0_g1_i1.p1  ORF type:complete len:568 (-),score=96.14 TRINITY_DN49693_c0_g1_i1:395-2098(-)
MGEFRRLRGGDSGSDTDSEEEEPPQRGSPMLDHQTRRAYGRGGSVSGMTSLDVSAVVLACLVNFLDSLGGSISTPVLPFYAKRQFGASFSEVGRLFSVFALAQTIAMPLLAMLSDRYGRRTVLLLSLAGTSAGSAWQGLAGTYMSLFLARAFSGFWAGISGVCQVYIVDIVPAEERPLYMSYLLSSTQAASLLGPSIGAGLSVLGLNVPILSQACVAAVVWPLVLAKLPESPEWLRLQTTSDLRSPNSNRSKPRSNAVPSAAARPPTAKFQRSSLSVVGWQGTATAIGAFGGVAMWAMMSQMAMVSMYAVYAASAFHMDSLHVGFATSLGAISSVLTNIWLSPPITKYLGGSLASMVGSVVVSIGAIGVLAKPIEFSLLGLMIAYQGLAINGTAVAVGAANLTDVKNRATVMTGVRMLKSLGAVIAPLLSGHLAGYDPSLPFVAAGIMALMATFTQLVTFTRTKKFLELINRRRTVGLPDPLDLGYWQDEYGTPEEICDLGNFVADLLTKRHYRWVTYNSALKNVLSDFFPPLPIESDKNHRSGYDWVRDRARNVHAQAMMVQDRGA